MPEEIVDMPNLAIVLRDEITRLCRKELRKEIAPVRKAVAAHRGELAELKRQLSSAQRRIQLLERQLGKSQTPATPAVASGKQVRFVAKGLRSMRARLGLSAADLARLVGVSEQSVYGWEAKKSVPRRTQVQALAQLRGIGKREAQARLEKLRT